MIFDYLIKFLYWKKSIEEKVKCLGKMQPLDGIENSQRNAYLTMILWHTWNQAICPAQ